MLYKLSALLSPQDLVLGQVLQWHSYAVVPLHVLDPDTTSTLTLLDQDGAVRRIAGTRLLALDRDADLVLLQLPAAVPGTGPAPLTPGAGCAGDAIEVHAVFHGRAPRDGLHTRAGAIRQVVEVRQHHYRAASGERIATQPVRALFLSMPFTLGWSGAPVWRADSRAIVGFLHGNASANGADGVCLLAAGDSPVVRMALGAPS